MQWTRTSRPASGAEHQFSHLWDMEHHTHNGKAPAHGFKVGIATLYISALYEQLLKHPVEEIDIAACSKQWPWLSDQIVRARNMFADTDFFETALIEIEAKEISKEKVSDQIKILKTKWPVLKERLEKQLLPFLEVKRRLQLVGAPVEPEDIGISKNRLCDSFMRAQLIRRRFTILDLAVRANCLNLWLEQMFGKE